MKRLLAAGMVAGALLLPQSAEASDELNSSMTATCLGGTCQTVFFHLNVEGDKFMEKISLFAKESSVWRILGIFGIFDKDWNDTSAEWEVPFNTATGVSISRVDQEPFTAEPLHIGVSFLDGQFGTLADMPGNITYTANGYTVASPGGSLDGFFSTSGTVTPEPMTVVLLGTGLVGVAGMGLRRRRREDEEEVVA